MEEPPHIRSLMISEYSARVMALNFLWPSQFSGGLVRRAYQRAVVSLLKRKRPPQVFFHIKRIGTIFPGRQRQTWKDGFRAFRYRAGDDRILYENSNSSYHYKECARGLVKITIVSDWLPEIICAAIEGKPLNEVVEKKGYLIQEFNPVIRRARNGWHRGQRAVILTIRMSFGTEFWDQACPRMGASG